MTPALQLGGHDPAQVDDLEGVLEDVLPVARPIAEPAQDPHELLVELAAVRLEDRLLARLADVLFQLGLRVVVHLLDPRRVDAPVLDQLLERQPGHLAAQWVERREDDRVRSVVDDEVDAREVLERADVAAFPPDDPPLQVVRGELDDGDRRLGGVARGDALESVRHEGASTAPGIRAGLLLHLPDVSRQLVAHEVLRALEQLLLRLVNGHAGDPLELGQRLVLAPA